jgi:cyclic beta-1,2-glucan synthetase
MDAHLFLCGCGANFDLVLLSRDGASYQRPLHSALSDALHRAGGELLRDRRGGVHLIEDAPETACIRAAAARHLDLAAPEPEWTRRTDYRAAALPPAGGAQPEASLLREWGRDGAFQFTVRQCLPPRAWQHVLTNGRFGYLATDCGSGHLWYRNARENQLTPWFCQPYAADGPERLLLACGGAYHDLFADPADGVTRVRYDFGSAVWERRCGTLTLRTTAFIPPETDARVLLIECEGLPDGARLHWQRSLQLAAARSDARFCRTARDGAFLTAENPRQIADARPFLATARPAMTGCTFARAQAAALDYDGAAAHDGEPVFAMTLPAAAATVLVCGCDDAESSQRSARRRPRAPRWTRRAASGAHGSVRCRWNLPPRRSTGS